MGESVLNTIITLTPKKRACSMANWIASINGRKCTKYDNNGRKQDGLEGVVTNCRVAVLLHPTAGRRMHAASFLRQCLATQSRARPKTTSKNHPQFRAPQSSQFATQQPHGFDSKRHTQPLPQQQKPIHTPTHRASALWRMPFELCKDQRNHYGNAILHGPHLAPRQAARTHP